MINRRFISIYIPLAVLVIMAILLWLARAYSTPWGDLSSIGQFLVELLLLPLAMLQLMQVTETIRRARIMPDLVLFVKDRKGNTTDYWFDKPVSREGLRSDCPIVLLNRGKRVAVWYSVELKLPDELLKGPCSAVWKAQSGLGENWRDLGSAPYDGAGIRKVFNSRGQEAAYPQQEQPLGALKVELRKGYEYPTKCEVEYVIYSDWGEPQRGCLVLHFQADVD